MVVTSCDIYKVSWLLTGKKGQLKNEIPSVTMMTNFGFGPTVLYVGFLRVFQTLFIHFHSKTNLILFRKTFLTKNRLQFQTSVTLLENLVKYVSFPYHIFLNISI